MRLCGLPCSSAVPSFTVNRNDRLVKQYFVYIVTNKRKTTLYTGMTSNLTVRLWQHKNGIYPQSFTNKYKTFLLLHVEVFVDPWLAVDRERQIKGWKRWKKVELIDMHNPGWEDLTVRWTDGELGSG